MRNPTKLLRRVAAALAVIAVAVTGASAQVKDYKKIKYPKLPEFQVAKPTVFTLGNGLQVFLLEDRELPLIRATALVRTGANWEPADKVGLAGIAGSVMRTGGTASMPGNKMDEYLESRAASVEVGIGDDSGFASMDCLKQDFDAVLKVFVDVLRNPAFPQDKIDLAKVQAKTGISRRNDEVGGIAARELTRLVYGNESPLARMEEYATIAAITQDDLASWHKQWFHPNNMMLGVVGDFDAADMRKKIEGAFGDWPKGPQATLTTPDYRKNPNSGVFLIEKTDVTQANIGMAHLGIEVKNPDYFAVQVMNEVMGGGFSSRMFSNIRSKKGLAYSVGGGLGASYINPGLFRAAMQTKSVSVFDAVDAMKAEIRGMIDNPPADDELAKAKQSILNSFVFNYDSKAKILRQQMNYAYYGLPADYLETYRTNIEKVTKEDVARVAKTYIHPDDLSILVVGNPADFGKPVDTLGKVTKIDITIPPPADAAPKVARTAEASAEGRKIFARAADALGGKDGAQVKAIRSTAKMTLNMQGQSLALSRDKLVVFPDRVRDAMTTPMGDQVMVLDGDKGFAQFGGQMRDLPAKVIDETKQELHHDLRFLVRYRDDPAMDAVAAGKDKVDGTDCEVVALTFRGTESRLCVAGDGKVLRQAYQGENPMTKAPGSVEVFYGDYRELGGRWVPHRQKIRIDGNEVVSLELESFQIDPPVDEGLFKKPAS